MALLGVVSLSQGADLRAIGTHDVIYREAWQSSSGIGMDHEHSAFTLAKGLGVCYLVAGPQTRCFAHIARANEPRN